MKIESIDSNFKTVHVGSREARYHEALEPPFVLTGFPWYDPPSGLNRLPSFFTENEVNAGALYGARFSTGGTIRVRTDSSCLALRARLEHSCDMNHMPRSGSAGFDLYHGAGGQIRYVKTVHPDRDQKEVEVLLVDGRGRGMTDWTLYLPLYGSASRIEIGLDPDAVVEAPTPQAVSKPVLFYGSSITQGGCASRPGNAYTSMLCRAVDAAQINMGFSGSGRGEPAVAEAIATLDLAAFVLDYDHNAPTAEHLDKTHGEFFTIVRQRHPELPVVMMSRCDYKGTAADNDRREIIRRTYEEARQAGDRLVWFVDGELLFGTEDRDACTVDGCHPNDIGFYRMYRCLLPVLREALAARFC